MCISQGVPEHTYPELSVARATLVFEVIDRESPTTGVGAGLGYI